MYQLAIKGGKRVRETLFPAYNTIGEEEIMAVEKVLKKGSLSRFLGSWHQDFYGGDEVQALEKEWAAQFNVKHAISVNSATSGLCCAVGAAGIGPGDEVIVTPYTMSATATAILAYNAIPVFCDIEEDTFTLDAKALKQKINERTKAIIVADIFGHPYDYKIINQIAKEHKLIVIEDSAQAPFAEADGLKAGTLADMGIYSLNYHKHIHSGEGGVVVTNDDNLAERVRLIRNHAEVVVEDKGETNLVNMLGFNFRMTEIEAAIAREQLKKLGSLIDERIKNVQFLENMLKEIPFLTMPKVRENYKHVYYVHAIKYDNSIAGVSRETYIDAVKEELTAMVLREKEGVQIGCGYVKPLYLLPLYQKQIAFGKAGCPFKCGYYKGKPNYEKGLCPSCEKMYFSSLITHEYMRPGMTHKDLEDVAEAFIKVYKNIEELM